jgi:hypothetical protein
MKNSTVFTLMALLLSMTLVSCDAIAGIFKAGMGFGIFLVVLVIVIIGAIVVKVSKKN